MEKVAIENGFTNNKNVQFSNICSRNFNKKNIFKNIGEYITETKKQQGFFFADVSINSQEGIYLFRDFDDENVAYRIYKDYANYGFNGNRDDILISELQSRKGNVLLTKFPYGVVSLDGNLIGQIIPYFDDYETLFKIVNKSTFSNSFEIYIQVLNILKELCNNNIYYLDIHPKNFMLKGNHVELIDFDYDYMVFDDNEYLDEIYRKIAILINYLNKQQNIDYTIQTCNSFDEYFNQLEQNKNLILK